MHEILMYISLKIINLNNYNNFTNGTVNQKRILLIINV